MISWWRTTFGELEIQGVVDAITHEHVGLGPLTEELESKLAAALGVPYAVMTTSGSAALLLSLLACGLRPDDEVVMPNRTWIATAHAALLIGGKARLVDVRADLPLMDTDRLDAACSQHSRVIMPVHLNGRATDMTAVNQVARARRLFVIEDACQALFSYNGSLPLGTNSDIGCYSLGLTKVISTGQGGFAVTRSQDLYEKLKLVRNHGVVDQFTDRWNRVGFNLKFTDVLAAIGLAQLQSVPERVDHLRKVYLEYRDGLREVPFLSQVPVRLERGEVPIYSEFLCQDRAALVSFLKESGIQTRVVPPNLSDSPYIGSDGQFPNSRRFAEQGIYLPSGPGQKIDDIRHVIDVLSRYPATT